MVVKLRNGSVTMDICVRDGKILFREDLLDRLERSCSNPLLDREQWSQWLDEQILQ